MRMCDAVDVWLVSIMRHDGDDNSDDDDDGGDDDGNDGDENESTTI